MSKIKALAELGCLRRLWGKDLPLLLVALAAGCIPGWAASSQALPRGPIASSPPLPYPLCVPFYSPPASQL